MRILHHISPLLITFFAFACSKHDASHALDLNRQDMNGSDLHVVEDLSADATDVGLDQMDAHLDAYIPPESCDVCQPGCDGIPRIEIDVPFYIPNESYVASPYTEEEIREKIPESGTRVQRLPRAPAKPGPDGTSAGIWTPAGEDLIFDLTFGVSQEIDAMMHFTVLVGEIPIEFDVTDKSQEGEWQHSSDRGVVRFPATGQIGRFAVRIDKDNLTPGEMNSVFVAMHAIEGRLYKVRNQNKFTVYVGGFDIPEMPCVEQQTRSLESAAESELQAGRFEMMIHGKLESREDEENGITLKPGETIEVKFFDRAYTPTSAGGNVPSAVAAFLDGRMITEPFRFLAYDRTGLPRRNYVSYRNSFMFTAPDTPGVYALWLMGWFGPMRPEVWYDGMRLGNGSEYFPNANGFASSSLYGSGVVLITVEE